MFNELLQGTGDLGLNRFKTAVCMHLEARVKNFTIKTLILIQMNW